MHSIIYNVSSLLSPSLKRVRHANAIEFSDKGCRLEIISKKQDLSRKRVTISHVTNPQAFCVAPKFGIVSINQNSNASAHTTKMVAASPSEMRYKLPIKTATQSLRVQSSTSTSTFALEKNKIPSFESRAPK